MISFWYYSYTSLYINNAELTEILQFCKFLTRQLPTGTVKQVEVFPSQYGKTQLAKELERGPDLGDDADDDHDEGKEYSTEALRKYQVC